MTGLQAIRAVFVGTPFDDDMREARETHRIAMDELDKPKEKPIKAQTIVDKRQPTQ